MITASKAGFASKLRALRYNPTSLRMASSRRGLLSYAPILSNLMDIPSGLNMSRESEVMTGVKSAEWCA